MRGDRVSKRKERVGAHLVTQRVGIHRDYLERLEALVPRLEASPEFAPAGRLLKRDYLRLALLAGIEALEDRLDSDKKGRA